MDANPFEDPPQQVGQPAAQTAGQLASLQAREAALAAREEALNVREGHLRVHGRNNWPPCYPLIYHDPANEIPAAHQRTVGALYILWLALVSALIINAITSLTLLLTASPHGLPSLISALTQLLFIPPLSFLLVRSCIAL